MNQEGEEEEEEEQVQLCGDLAGRLVGGDLAGRPDGDLYSSVASSLNHYYSANISSACEPPPQQRQPSTKKTKQVKNEVIDTVESSV